MIANTAKALIDRAFQNELLKGTALAVEVQHVVTGPGAYDPATGDVTDPAAATHIRQAIVREYSTKEVAFSNGLLKLGDLMVMLRPEDGKPSPLAGHRVTWGGKTYTARRVEDRLLGGQPLLHVCTCELAGA